MPDYIVLTGELKGNNTFSSATALKSENSSQLKAGVKFTKAECFYYRSLILVSLDFN